MATSFAGTVKVLLSGTYTKDVDLGTLTYNLNSSYPITLTNGTGADQANMIFSDTRTLVASATENLDLYGGLTDAFGATINFTKIKGIIVSAASANTNDVILGGDATTTFFTWVGSEASSVAIKPGGTFCLMSPNAASYAVTTSTLDLLMVTNSSSGTPVTYDIVLIGTV